ncbi:MFS transporter [Levilactobacillus sp. N40-8-2]|uniref:MFS transporter n=1 Tax=Levilactobacillus muriae TaxID=3238987 RepID=UPI0038B35D3F
MENQTTEVTQTDSVKLSWRERIGFGQLDLAGQLVFNMITVYLLYYFTDVALIPVGTAGTILFIARIFDALDAPIWGTLIDMTHTRWGKARPYFLWVILPFTISAILTFSAPNLSLHAKIWYCAITYICTGVLYTGLNTPLATVLPLLTRDPQERLTLNSIRMTFGQVGVLIVNALGLPLVAFFGKGNKVVGFRWTIIIFALVGMILTLVSFSNIKERVKPVVQKVSIKKSVRAMKNNWPWVIIIISNLFLWIALTSRSSTIVYYMTYNYGNQDMTSVLNSMKVIQVVTTLLIPLFARKLSKKIIWITGLIMCITGQLIIGFAGMNLPVIIVGWLLGCLGIGFAVTMPFALIGATVDYGEWKNGINAAGLLTAIGTSFCIKLGSGIGGMISAKVMAAFGYVANKTQTAAGLQGISISFVWVTIIALVIAMVPLFFYGKYERLETKITDDLNERKVQA